jgi:hypothetical protein
MSPPGMPKGRKTHSLGVESSMLCVCRKSCDTSDRVDCADCGPEENETLERYPSRCSFAVAIACWSPPAKPKGKADPG